jgi:hypothetical protein
VRPRPVAGAGANWGSPAQAAPRSVELALRQVAEAVRAASALWLEFQAAGGSTAFGRCPEAPREAAYQEGSAPARVAHEEPDRAAFAPWQAARRDEAVVAERAARWRAPAGREVHWRLADVAGPARQEARPERGAGRLAAFPSRLAGTERLVRRGSRPLWARRGSSAGRRRQKALRYKAEGNSVSWFLALWGDRNPLIAAMCGFDIEPRWSVEVDDSAPPRDLMRQPSDCKRSQHAKTAAKAPDFGILIRLADDLSQAGLAVNALHALRSTSSFFVCAIA